MTGTISSFTIRLDDDIIGDTNKGQLEDFQPNLPRDEP